MSGSTADSATEVAAPPLPEAAQMKLLADEMALHGVAVPSGDWESDEPVLTSSLHLQQLLLLLKCLDWYWRNDPQSGVAHQTDYFAAGNLTVYYSPRQRKSEDFRGPDFFVVLGTDRSRKSWVVWEEDGKYPNIIIELLSNSTAATDRGFKKQLYQDTFRTPDYFWFDPARLEFQGFHLVDGQYEAIPANAAGHLWSQQLELYLGIQQQALRFFTADGQLVLTPEESTAVAQASAEAAQTSAEAAQAAVVLEQQKNDRLAAKLRELGVAPDELLTRDSEQPRRN